MEFKYDHGGEKWSNIERKEARGILQYSLDGEHWIDVECLYFEVPQGEMSKYKWK
jgi:hypothetical protein